MRSQTRFPPHGHAVEREPCAAPFRAVPLSYGCLTAPFRRRPMRWNGRRFTSWFLRAQRNGLDVRRLHTPSAGAVAAQRFVSVPRRGHTALGCDAPNAYWLLVAESSGGGGWATRETETESHMQPVVETMGGLEWMSMHW